MSEPRRKVIIPAAPGFSVGRIGSAHGAPLKPIIAWLVDDGGCPWAERSEAQPICISTPAAMAGKHENIGSGSETIFGPDGRVCFDEGNPSYEGMTHAAWVSAVSVRGILDRLG